MPVYPIKIDIGHEIFKLHNGHDLPVKMIREHKAFISMSLGIQKIHNYMQNLICHFKSAISVHFNEADGYVNKQKLKIMYS